MNKQNKITWRHLPIPFGEDHSQWPELTFPTGITRDQFQDIIDYLEHVKGLLYRAEG